MPHAAPFDRAALAAALAPLAPASAAAGPWESGSLAALAEAGVLARFVPAAHGGSGATQRECIGLLGAIAEQCLTTALVVSQWAAAVRLIEGAPDDVSAVHLPALARGERFTTVGISQLTTSRRHLATAAVRAARDGGTWRLDGDCPWVTGADRADTLVVGAADDDGTARMFLVERTAAGVAVGAPLAMLALSGSRTTTVGLRGVRPLAILETPDGGVRTGGLATIALALGAARAAVAIVAAEARGRADLAPVAAALAAPLDALAAELDGAAEAGIEPAERDRLRAAATGLALRAAQAALTASKGAGFLVGHPAERLVREACFFLVWSCPPAVAGSVLCSLAGLGDGR